MAAPHRCAMRPESPLMPGRAVTPRPNPAAFIRGVHALAMRSCASTSLAAGRLLGDVCVLLHTGLPAAYARVDHAWRDVAHLHESTHGMHQFIISCPKRRNVPWTGRAEVHEQGGPPAGPESVEQFLEMNN